MTVVVCLWCGRRLSPLLHDSGAPVCDDCWAAVPRERCAACGGRGITAASAVCPACHGIGQVPVKPAPEGQEGS